MNPKALLEKGTHELTLDEVHTLCVAAFEPHNRRREALFVQFTDFLIYFKSLGFNPVEIWIDGSYLTDKLETGDIDLLISVHMGEINLLPRSVQDQLFTEFGGGPSKRRFECEALIVPSADEEMLAQRLKSFSNSNSRNTFKKKGIIKLKM